MCLSVAPRGSRVACGTMDAQIIVFSAKTGKPRRSFKGHESTVSAVNFLGEGKRLLSTSWDCTTRLWQPGDEKEYPILKHNAHVKALAVNSEFTKGAAGGRDGEVKIFSTRNLKCIRNLQAHQTDVSGLAFTNDGSRLVTASWDGECKLWDLSSYELIRNLTRQKERIRSIAIMPDDARVFAGLHDGTILSLRLDVSGRNTKIEGHSDVVTALAVDPTGTYLVSGDWDRTLRVWILDGENKEIEAKSTTGISALTWAPKGKVFYTTHFSGSLVAWILSEE